MKGHSTAPAVASNADSGDIATGGRASRASPMARIALAVAQALTFAGFVIALGGLAQLQKKANALQLDAATQLVYTDAFQSAGQIPYPTAGKYQLELQWYILFGELLVFLAISALLAFPRKLVLAKPALLGFLVYFFVLWTLQVNSLLYFKRSAAAALVFGAKPIKAALSGATIVVVANAISIIALGMVRDSRTTHGHLHGHAKHQVADGHNTVSAV